MSKAIEQRMDVDCIWQHNVPEVEDTHLLVIHQEEHGHATALVGAGLTGDAEPIACLFSKLMETPTINYVPQPTWVEYRLYETRSNDGRRFWVLRIPKVHPVHINPNPHVSNVTWLYTYPIVRDIVMILSQYGVRRMSYITTNLFSMHREYRDYMNLDAGHVAQFDFADTYGKIQEYFGDISQESDEVAVLAPNVWIWGHVFSNFCTNCLLSEVILGSPTPTFVDDDCADSLLNHLQLQYNLPYDRQAYTQLSDALKSVTDAKYVKVDLEDSDDDNVDRRDFVP